MESVSIRHHECFDRSMRMFQLYVNSYDMYLNRCCLGLLLVAVGSLHVCGADLLFFGGDKEIISVTPERNTGLDVVYVVYDMANISSIKVMASPDVVISRFSNLGGGFAEPAAFHMDGQYAVIDTPEGDMGYIVQSQGKSSYFWIVNYHEHMFSLQEVRAAAEQVCDNTAIDIVGAGDPIYYYSIDGRRCELTRDIEVKYDNLEWSDEDANFKQSSIIKTLPHLTGSESVTPPLYCSSTFTVSGDKFLEHWGLVKSVVSETVQPNGLNCHTTAVQTNLPDESEEADASNVIKTELTGIGGSAPVDVSFTAWTTDAVIHNEWQIASDEQFEYIDYRFNEQNLDYTFVDEGTYFIRYMGSNSDGSCETVGETYTVSVGSSELKIPNAFTPNGDGINDVWKVSYRSLLDFECSIFDRYGTLLCHFSDPSEGWDGKYNGKTVKPGVYFYVIEAKGADGKDYKEGGDINIIKSKRYGNTTGGEGTVEGGPSL